jgi:hypothetical protein
MATTGTFSNLRALFKESYANRHKQAHNNISINPLKPVKQSKHHPSKHPYTPKQPLKFPKKSHPRISKFPRF